MLFGVKANVGSNPTVTAKENPRESGGFLHSQGLRGAFVVHIPEDRGHNEVLTHRLWCVDGLDGGFIRPHLSDGSSIWASLLTNSGVCRPLCSSKATRNRAARIVRRK
jgi:hypothetical protein